MSMTDLDGRVFVVEVRLSVAPLRVGRGLPAVDVAGGIGVVGPSPSGVDCDVM